MGETTIASVTTRIPLLPLQWNWLHSCVAISCDTNQISAVVNGVMVLDTQFNTNTPCPTSLDGNLVLQKFFSATGYWGQNQGRVTNVNIFSGLMSEDRMVSRTSGEDCGKQDGDYLRWTNSSWSLEGAANWTEVSVEDLCRKFSNIQLFSTQRVTKPDDCKHLCQKMNSKGRTASVETPELLEKLQGRLRLLAPQLDRDGSNPIVVWLPISRQNDIWLDNYTNKTISSEWETGFPLIDSKRNCAILGSSSKGLINFYCTYTSAERRGFYCSCDLPEQPFLTLRGLCRDSYLDQLYLPQNSPLDAETTFYGNRISVARFLKEESQWKIKSNGYNTSALSKEISGRFMLGKQIWKIKGDSKKCNESEIYNTQLKLTGCKEKGEFTCDDGQCVKMVERSNQVPDCRDKSDENGCQLIVFENNYKKNIPPIG